ncbi:EEIG1/EHBP1 N-terminal domain containing protein [Trema orientale]|uniref:EEIG1/EHBP1 N-terminal domain containing protein n=1 Tax=Trema orientale TaxID=63057 RepID=A0A2P5ELQ5_TREOI|nr:EEIG1/EHBP1 N-terminal domain containing protein [Trema orientale]
MFKSARWRSEKNKIKAVFKLQFHATQVRQSGVDALMVSVIPGDLGKPSVKLDKATILDGSCRWENPVYETVKFSREPRTGKISEKIYRFSVSNGSAKGGVFGEASIDFAAYAEANKASTVSLPLKNSSSDAILHVLIQRVQENVDQREVEECDQVKPRSQDRSLKTHLSNGDTDNNIRIGAAINKTTNNGELNGNHRESSGSDITLSSSDSSSGVNTPRELGLRSVDVHQEPSAYLSSLNHHDVPHKKAPYASTAYEEHQRSQWEWSGGSDHGVSTDDSTQSSQNILTRENSQQASDVEIEKLKADLIVLARQADVSEMELQTLRKQIIKESKRGIDLSREVVSLTEERDAFKAECERLKSYQRRNDDVKVNNRLQLEGGDLRALLEEIRQELNYEKDLNGSLRLQLQKTQESNTELILAVRDLEEMLEQRNKETSNQPNLSVPDEDDAKLRANLGKCESDEDEEQKALEKLVKGHRDANQTTLLEQKIIDLYSEIEIYRRDRDELEMQMEQLALDYEILKQENHDISYKLEQSQLQEQLKMQYECSSPLNELECQIGSLEKELKMRSEEYSDSLATIKEFESHIKSLEEELKTRSKELSDSLVTVKEHESHIKSLEEELKTRSKKLSDSLETVKEQESHIKSLEEELKTQSKEFSDSLTTIRELESHTKSLEEELKTQSKEFSDSLVTIKELESHAKNLEEELKTQSKEFPDSLVTTKELESHIKSLEEELEEQAQGFEADLEALTLAKVEQEQRAIRAEEALRKMRWKNANTAEKLQEEFRRLSMQMASTFNANEKVAMKAMAEASELRVQKSQLEEMLQKAKDELQGIRDEYEAKLHDLSSQIEDKITQIEKMSLETDSKTKQLEHQKKHEAEIRETFCQEISQLKAEIERLKTKTSSVSEQAEQNKGLAGELEKMKISAKEHEKLVEKGNAERDELVNTIALMKKEAGESLEELNRIKNLKDEKEAIVELLQSELEKLKTQCDSLKLSLLEDEVEKEKLRNQVLQLKSDLKKKDDAFTSIEKKLKDSNGRIPVSDGTKTSPKNNKSAAVPRGGPKEVASLREKIKLLEGQIKVKEAALEVSSSSFLEKEKDLQNKIEELESQVEELNQNSAFRKVVKDASTLTSNEDEMSSMKRDEIASEEGNKASSLDNRETNLDNLVTELASLKEKNKLMESELKDMQERYSEISLKFAEVEGERQKLVMTVRNLKNAKKS